jgi:hypothetical protein
VDRELIALLFWMLLFLSIVLTITGVATQKPAFLIIAAAISLPLGVVALFSIGIFILFGAMMQFVVGIAMARGQRYERLR